MSADEAVVEVAARGRAKVLQGGYGTTQEAFEGRDWLAVAMLASIWGSSFLLMDIGLDALNPGVVTMGRVALGAAALAVVSRARVPIDPEDRRRIAALGLIWVGIPLSLFPLAQQHISSSVAGMLNGGMPLTSALFSVILLRSLPGRRQLVGIGIGFLGILAISWPGLRDGASATLLGTGLVVTAIMLYGLATNMTPPLQQKYGALPVIWRAQLAALVVVVPLGLLDLPGSHFQWGPVLALIPLGFLGTGVAFVMMAALVGRVGGPRGAVSTYFVPVVAVLLGVTLRDDAIEAIALVGMGLVLLGAWLTSRREG